MTIFQELQDLSLKMNEEHSSNKNTRPISDKGAISRKRPTKGRRGIQAVLSHTKNDSNFDKQIRGLFDNKEV